MQAGIAPRHSPARATVGPSAVDWIRRGPAVPGRASGVWRRGAAVFLTLAAVAVLPATEVRARMLLLDGVVVGGNVIAVGERGAVLLSADNARTWRQAPPVTRATLTAVAFAPVSAGNNPSRGWAVGHDALILATADGGATWARQYQGENLQDSFLDVWAVNESHVIAVGAYGLFVETKDGGKSWERRRLNDADLHFNRLTQGPSGTLYLAGERGTMLRSRDRGATWTPITAPYDGSFYGILPLELQTLLAYGLRGHVYRSTDDGASWTAVETPAPVLLATAIRMKNGTIALTGYAATLWISRDEGRTLVPFEPAPAKAVAQLLELPDAGLLALGEAGASRLAPLP